MGFEGWTLFCGRPCTSTPASANLGKIGARRYGRALLLSLPRPLANYRSSIDRVALQARFFLVGMGHNAADPSMEHGFKTNVDMLRA